MVFQQGGQLISGCRAIIRLDGIADINLVLQQALGGGDVVVGDGPGGCFVLRLPKVAS